MIHRPGFGSLASAATIRGDSGTVRDFVLRRDHLVRLVVERSPHRELAVSDVGPLRAPDLAGAESRLGREQHRRAIPIAANRDDLLHVGRRHRGQLSGHPPILNRSFEHSPVAYLLKLDSTASRLLTVFALRPSSSAATNPSTVGWSRSPIVISPEVRQQPRLEHPPLRALLARL
jgi:hypothetical protein